MAGGDGAAPSTGAAIAQQRPTALRDALRLAGKGFDSDASIATTASDSPSEEDYDELTAPPADAMVLRQRRKPGQQDTNDKTKSHTQSPLKTAEVQSSAVDAPMAAVPPLSSRTQRGGRKLSATVIFEEKSGMGGQTLSSAATAVSSSRSIDSDGGLGTVKEDYPAHKDGRQSFVVSIDDPKLAEILRADLEHLREDLEDRQVAPLAKEGDNSVGRSTAVEEKTQANTSQNRDPAPASTPHKKRKHRGRFRDLVFTRGFSTFDRQNADAANSPFHGFFTLFWIAVFLFMVRIAAENWRKTGSPLGTNEIMANMFHRDVVILLLSDGMLCALTGVSWLIQLVVFDGRLMDWDGAGWIIQNIWQTLFVAGFIGWTHYRDWPWSHTVFFVLHGFVMLMKQHSYAFYNGYLSSIYRRREVLQTRLEELRLAELAYNDDTNTPPGDSVAGDAAIAAVALASATGPAKHNGDTPSQAEHTVASTATPAALDKIVAALQSGQPLDSNQALVFERILRWEIDGLTEELRGKSTRPEKAYPHNLTFTNHYEYIILPTLVYELEYPRSESISWRYAAEKLVAVFGIIFVMIMISQTFMYPVVMRTLAMKEAGMPLVERFKEFPWMLSDLIFPFMMEYLLTWYLIWETILNFLAEITYFADRSFYSAWWNSVTWDEFARDWNRPVHLFLLRHVYHSSISAMKVNKHTATLITFFLSACIHELVMWCIFKKLRGYLLVLQMCQLPLVRLSRTKWMRNRQTLGNVIFWTGIFMGPTILCSLYLIL